MGVTVIVHCIYINVAFILNLSIKHFKFEKVLYAGAIYYGVTEKNIVAVTGTEQTIKKNKN